jgi:hypothetical protein
MSTLPQVSGWQAGFLSMLPTVETHARIQFRKLRAEKRAEMIQETIAAACVQFQLAASQGKLHAVRPGMLADFAVRHTREGRHVGGIQDRSKDVLSPNCHRRHGVQLQSFYVATLCRGTDGWRQVALSDRKVPVPDLAAFRIDFARWLKTLCHRDRRIIAAFVAGQGTSFVADKFGMTAGRVSQLRRKYQQMWAVFQGEAKTEERSRHAA